MVVSGAPSVKMAVQAWVAGVGSTLPEISTARTSKVWAAGDTKYSAGDKHGTNGAESSRHSKVTEPTLSLPLKWKVASPVRLGCVGPCKIRVSGGIGSGGAPAPVQRTL